MPDSPFIPVAKPWIGAEEAQAATRPVLAGWVTQGPEVAAFEREFAASVGAPFACAVANCTAALHLALRAAGVGPGGEVITVSHSFVASANSVRYCGATPVFVDIDPDTYNLDTRRIEAAISDRTQAILCVHQMGMPCDMESLLWIAGRFSIPVVEDAACAAGSDINFQGRWEPIGRPHGLVACFSFHPRKIVTTGDGGMITTSDETLDRRVRSWRQHSMSVSDTVRHSAAQVTFEEYPELGFNYRMTDIQAAVGREQLKRLPEMLKRRRDLADRYSMLIGRIEGITPPSEPSYARSNWQSYCVRAERILDQKALMQFMLDSGIATRRGIMCAHREAAYSEPGSWRCGVPGCDSIEGSCGHLAASEDAQASGIILPLYHQMTYADQDRIVAALENAVQSQSFRSTGLSPEASTPELTEAPSRG
jgi:dTDP-4-amino-4,6-dideoxygalactose transaminase